MICPECERNFGYIRLKSKEWICRNCATTTKIKDIKTKLKNIAGI